MLSFLLFLSVILLVVRFSQNGQKVETKMFDGIEDKTAPWLRRLVFHHFSYEEDSLLKVRRKERRSAFFSSRSLEISSFL